MLAVTRSDVRYGNKGQYVCKVYPSGDFSVGRSQPLKSVRSPDTLEGICKDGLGISIPARQLDTKPNADRLFAIAEKFNSDRPDLAYQFGQAAGKAAILEAGDRQHWVDPCDGLSEAFWGERLRDVRAAAFKHYQETGENCRLERQQLGLSVAVISHKPAKKRRGEGGITSLNKRYIKSAWALLEREHGRRCLSFGTSTLPNLSDEDLLKVCVNWSDLVRKFFQELTRLLERRGYSTNYLFVTEIQEDRYLATGKVCPHLHWVAQGKKHQFMKGWAIDKSEIKDLWARMLSNLLGHDVPAGAATRVEQPKKDLTSELGKYLSKGGKQVKQITEDGNAHLLPSAYVGMSKALKAQIKKEIVTMTGDDAADFLTNLKFYAAAGFLKFREIAIEYLGRSITVGWVGFIIDKAFSKELRIAA